MKRLLSLVAGLFLVLCSAVPAEGHQLQLRPHQLKFGKQPFGSTTLRTVQISNASSHPLSVSVESINVPDPFSPGQVGSTCQFTEATPLEPGQSCFHIVGFYADPSPTFAGRQTGELGITARDANGALVDSTTVRMSATSFEPTLTSLIDAGDRSGIGNWMARRSIGAINDAVAALDQARRDRLAEVVLDTNATSADRDKMVRVMRTVLANRDLGFYAEIWSYTFVELAGDGFFGTCNHLFLSPSAWAGLSDEDARAVLMHESFHSFNCENGGPVGSLDEGSAIWIVKATFGGALHPGESWAEATYGTKLYYKVFFNNPDFPLTAPLNPTAKLLDVYAFLAANDPSQLPWNSTDRLVSCFEHYFADLDRNVDFYAVWLPAVAERTQQMLADSACKPL
jgi:hypothetical protein